MLQKLKRAFTITELVIVIALVAILAAVLIPTFANVVKNANESADTQTVKHLNTIIASEQTISREPAANMTQVLEQAEEGGYVVEKLTPVSDGDIVWEQTSNRFALISSDGKMLYKEDATPDLTDENAYQFWKITDSESEAKEGKFSYYLRAGAFDNADLGTVTHGIDVGENENVKISYVSEAAQTAIFRTNGSTLFINAPSAEVYHYGVSESVDIEAVAPNSYYLNATVRSSVTIQSGRVYVTARGSVPTINAMPKAGTVAIAGDTGAQIGNIFVPVNQEGVKIDSSVSSETEIGVPTQEMGLFGGGNGTQQSPFLIGTAEQFMAINELSSPSYFFKLTDNIDLTAETAEKGSFVQYFSNAVLDGAGFTVKANADLFARFDGSTLKNVTVEMNGDDLHLTGMDYTADCLFENVTLEGAVKFTGRNQGLFVVYSGIGSASKAKTLTFRGCVNNIDITGVGGESDYNAVFVGYSWGSVNLVFEDCVNNGTLTCGEAGIFLGNQANQANFVTMTIDNFVNNGTLTSTNPRDTYNQYIGRPAGASQNITVDGSKIASLKDGKWLNITQAVSDATLDIALNEDGTFEVTAATAGNAVSYRITYGDYFSWWAQSVDDEGELVYDEQGEPVYETVGTQIQYITEDFMAEDFADGTYTSAIKWLGYVTTGYMTEAPSETLGGYTVVTIDGKQYYRVQSDQYKLTTVENAENGSEEGVRNATKNVTIIAYDVNGTIVASKTVAVA